MTRAREDAPGMTTTRPVTRPADTGHTADTGYTADTGDTSHPADTAHPAHPGDTAHTEALEADLLDGFFDDPPTVPPRWFYDETGSLLFDEITRLDEYYPTRAEAQILRTRAAGIVGDATTVIELGAGSCEKTRVLLDELAGRAAGRDAGGSAGRDAGAPTGANAGGEAGRVTGGAAGADVVNGAADGPRPRFVPVDISAEMLEESARALATEYPGLGIEPVVGDLTALDGPLPGEPGRRLVLFLGGTVGNFTESQRGEFLTMVRGLLAPGDRFAMGFDLVKDPGRLVAAYDDARGVTAEFNRNMLDVICRTVDCHGLERCDFRHQSVWNARESRIEMWLRAVRDVRVEFPTLGLARTLAAGEGIRTEIARKFEPDVLVAELASHGFTRPTVWRDEGRDFGMVLVVVE